ncbi:MAG: septum formation initiator family protein [Candidatus Pacebacteria bacterium]|nr:septum formation initiator family protein [Candidatus Paceibacterota bacterium]
MVAKKAKKGKRSIEQRFAKFFGAICFAFLFIYLAFANIKIFIARNQAAKDLVQLESTEGDLVNKQEKLSVEMGKTGSDEFLDRVAREEYGLQKEGEEVIVVRRDDSTTLQAEAGNKGLQIFQDFVNWLSKLINRSPE